MNTKLKKQILVSFLSIALFGCVKEDEPNLNNKPGEDKFPCYINGDYTLTNKNATGFDYVIDCMVEVSNGALKIEPGVEIQFKVGAGIIINENAYIIALGNDSMKINLNGVSNLPSWNGIIVKSNDPRNKMEYCNINAAGNENIASTTIGGFSYSVKSALTVFGKLSSKKCNISNSGGNGLFIDQDASSVFTDSLSFDNCTNFPIYIYGGFVSNMKLETNTFKNNPKNFIGIFSTTSNEEIGEDVNFKKTAIPYLFTHNIDFTKNAIIEAGVIIYVNADQGISVNYNGQLKIKGTETNPVQIRGLDSLAGFWKGIYIGSETQNHIDYLNISNGGSSTFYACPKSNILVGNEVTPAKLTLSNSTSVNYDGTCQIGVEVDYSNGKLINNSPEITQICEY